MKICFITGSRADYGLLTSLMSLVKKDKKFASINRNRITCIKKTQFNIQANY